MSWRTCAAAVLCVVTVVSCAPAPDPAPLPEETSSATPEPEETPAALPMPYSLERDLHDGGAIDAVRQLLVVADNRPALKLDITAEQVTLTVLDENLNPAAYRWQDDLISAVASDVQYVEQSTFYPASFPLEDIRRVLDTAALLGAGGDQVLQIMEYRDGAVHMIVTTRTESQTIFFNRDGTVVPRLGTLSTQDIRRGFGDLTAGSPRVLAMGFEPGQGYWADVQISDTVIERRARMGGVPVFASQRNETSELTPIDVDEIDPGTIARNQSRFGRGEGCEVTIDRSHDPAQTTIGYVCDGEQYITDTDGQRLSITDD